VLAGQRLAFNIDPRNGSNPDTYLRLFNAAGAQLAFNDNGAAPGETLGKTSYLAYTFATAGAYYVGVSSAGNTAYNPVTGCGGTAGKSTGLYHLAVTKVAAVSPPLRVNAGGGSYVDPGGTVGSADTGFGGGRTNTTAA